MRYFWSKLFAVACLACGCAVAVAAPLHDDRPVVRIGLVDTFSPEFYINTYAATVQYLKRQLPQYRFESVEFANDAAVTPQEVSKLDFLVSSAGTFGIRGPELGAEHIVIRKRSDVNNASRSVAAVFVTRAGNARINSLQDMRHKRVTATNPASFDGWLIAQDELAQAGFSPENFFSTVQFTDEPCRRSSDLYPAEVIAVFPHTDPELAKAVTIALLQMPENDSGEVSWEWVTVNDMVNISGLMERLSLGSFAYQREFTIEALAHRYSRELILIAALIAATLFHIFRVDRLVMQRTRELVQTVKEKEALLERMKRTQQYLQLLERNTIVSQLSSLFAHEMKQPVTNIINYATGLEMLRKSGRDNTAAVDQALTAINDQAHRMAQIVDRVRAYAKHEPQTKSECLLSDIVSTMLENFRMAQKSVSSIVVDVPNTIRVSAEPVALELLLLNLVRNAERAAAAGPSPQVFIVARTEEHTVRVTVSDNGPRVPESLFGQLGRIGGVQSSQGLGMGLAIAKGIAENHNGHLEFSRSKDGGLAVTLVMTTITEEENTRGEKPSA